MSAEWWKNWQRDRRARRASVGSGRGGPLGTPSMPPPEAPPGYDQEANAVVSGGGLVGRSGGDPAQEARRSPSSAQPD